jgi:integron integrase
MKKQGIHSRKKPRKLLDQLRDIMRLKHYSIRTERSYTSWIKRFILFHDKRHPKDMGEPEVEAFLTWLAVDRKVANSTQNQAFNALIFLYRDVLKRPLEGRVNAVRSRKKQKLPIVMSKDETLRILRAMNGTTQLMAKLLYGSGLRLMECIRLRVKDIDFEINEIRVHSGKGDRDRLVPLPESVKPALGTHLERVKLIHENDISKGYGEVYMPNALDRKDPKAGKEWGWQYVFPSSKLSQDPRKKVMRRHHMDPSTLDRAIKRSVKLAGIEKRVTSHTFRHSFATHLLQTGTESAQSKAFWGIAMSPQP